MRKLKSYLFKLAVPVSCAIFYSLNLNPLMAEENDLIAHGGHGGGHHGGHHGHHGHHHGHHHHHDRHRGDWHDHHGEWNHNWNGENGNPGFYSDPANYYQIPTTEVIPATNTQVVPVQVPTTTQTVPVQKPTNYKFTQPAVGK